MTVVGLHEELRPVVRGHFKEEFEDFRLLVRFTDDVDARHMLG